MKPSAYANPQAIEVNVRKNERRYVNDGSGRWYVFVVCFYPMLVLQMSRSIESAIHGSISA